MILLSKKERVIVSPAEAKVLQLLIEGQSNKGIAYELGVVVKTVEKHRDNLMKKFSALSSVHLGVTVITRGYSIGKANRGAAHIQRVD